MSANLCAFFVKCFRVFEMPVEYLEFSTNFYKLFWVFLEKRKRKRAVSPSFLGNILAFLQLTFANRQDRCSSNHRLLPSFCLIWLLSGPCILAVCLLWALFSPGKCLCFALNSCSTNQVLEEAVLFAISLWSAQSHKAMCAAASQPPGHWELHTTCQPSSLTPPSLKYTVFNLMLPSLSCTAPCTNTSLSSCL